MAYMNQERKAKIAAALKKIEAIRDWKYTLRGAGGSGVTMTIMQADMDLMKSFRESDPNRTDAEVNKYYLGNQFEGAALNVMNAVLDALNLVGDSDANYDNSDSMTDYFDVGWYVYIKLGRWDSPFLDVIPRSERKNTKKPKSSYANSGPVAKKAVKAAISYYLPSDFYTLSPGRKAAATKRAMQLAGL